MLGRASHVIGMDSEGGHPARVVGVLTSLLTQVGLVVVAVLILLGKF